MTNVGGRDISSAFTPAGVTFCRCWCLPVLWLVPTTAEVATLVNEFRNTGYYTVEFDAKNLTSGMYYYRMEVNGFTKVLKMSLVK